jgi:hypothetical protein
MVEAFAVASRKGDTGNTTSTLAVGMALAADTDIILLDSAPLESKCAVFPIVLADRFVIIPQPTVPSFSGGLSRTCAGVRNNNRWYHF